jgi:hypothetical protein
VKSEARAGAAPNAAREVALRILDNAAALCKTQWQGGNEEFEIYKEYMQRQWQGR